MTNNRTDELTSENTAKENIADSETVQRLSEIAVKGTTTDSETARMLRVLAKSAPDILEVVTASISNPFAGLGLAVRKIAERAKSQPILEAQIQEDAEKKFLAKVTQEENRLPVDQNNLVNTNFLTSAMNRVAEDAVQLNDQKLMNEVLGFYNYSSDRLILSELNKSRDNA